MERRDEGHTKQQRLGGSRMWGVGGVVVVGGVAGNERLIRSVRVNPQEL